MKNNESCNFNVCPETVFYEVDQKNKSVYISAELVYNGNDELELIEYVGGDGLDYRNLNSLKLYSELTNTDQYYEKLTQEQGKDLIKNYFAGLSKTIRNGDLFNVNRNTPSGCYRYFWGD
ncbi:MAG: hypothetical protein IJI83_03115 [Oscillospiraceae bacterium]|nr:hypothetical protein [Oscillospiraceae bacterium]